jgi:hypothetical protein
MQCFGDLTRLDIDISSSQQMIDAFHDSINSVIIDHFTNDHTTNTVDLSNQQQTIDTSYQQM